MTENEPNPPITNVIFRFRDLVTPEGGTIADHEAIARDKGYVWWGWWAKAGESAPVQALQELCSGPSYGQFFLFDSGRLKLYSIDCSNFESQARGKAFRSPEPDRTPAYYNSREYMLWLRLSKFTEIHAPLDVLRRYAYRRVDELFENGKSGYGRFYDKVVYSLEELRQQDRTIWFVGPLQNSDGRHEISLFSANKLTPSNFVEAYSTSKHANLLWLSDIHCGEHHGFPKESDGQDLDLGTAIENVLGTSAYAKYGGMIVTGDLTWKADPEEFHAAAHIIGRLSRSPSTLADPYRITVCPGNHDLCFSDDPANKGAPVKVADDSASAAFASFYEDLFWIRPNKFLCSGRRILLAGCIPVEIVSMNTSMLQQKPGSFQGHGFAGQEQIRFIEKEFGWKDNSRAEDGVPRPYRILVLHHHLVPTNYVPDAVEGYNYSLVLDAGRIIDFVVENRVDVVLHGHMHHCFFSKERRKRGDGTWHEFCVAGLGSSGVEKQHRDGDNVFGVLCFADTRQPKLLFFKVHPRNRPDSTPFQEWDLSRLPHAQNSTPN